MKKKRLKKAKSKFIEAKIEFDAAKKELGDFWIGKRVEIIRGSPHAGSVGTVVSKKVADRRHIDNDGTYIGTYIESAVLYVQFSTGDVTGLPINFKIKEVK